MINLRKDETSASRQAKLKEWQCNVFSLGEREELPLFNRKKRSTSSHEGR
jgi:hypothetical protein